MADDVLTALYGDGKYEEIYYGPTVETRPRFGLEVDWANKSFFTGANEGIYMQDLEIDRGRKYTISADGKSLQAEETGRFSGQLLDLDGRFNPYNSESELYGLLGGGKYFRVHVRTPNDAYYHLMAGMVNEPVNYEENGIEKVRLEGSDGWGFLRNQNNLVTIPLRQDIYADEAMQLVLDAARYPRIWGRDLGEGVDVRPYFWLEGKSAAQALHELAHNELGTISIAADGKMRFRSRMAAEEETMVLTDVDIRRNGLTRMSPAEVVRNSITVESNPRTEESVQTVWEIPGRLEIAAGETVDDVFADFQYNNERVPVKDPITPVISTDYDASQFEDGTGTSYTSDISVAMYAYSTRAKLSITNNGLAPAWVYVRVRGVPIVSGNKVSFFYEDKASIRQFGPRPFTLTVDQNVNVARQYRDVLKTFLTKTKDYVVIDLVPNPEVQFAIDLGMIVRGSFENYGINQAYRVIRLRHKFADKAGLMTNTRVWLEPYVRLFTGVQLPAQLPFQLGGS